MFPTLFNTAINLKCPHGCAICNLYSITTNQAAIAALFRVVNRYVGNLPPMPGVLLEYTAPVFRRRPGRPESGK